MFSRMLKRPRTTAAAEPSAAKPTYEQLEDRLREVEAQLQTEVQLIENIKVSRW